MRGWVEWDQVLGLVLMASVGAAIAFVVLWLASRALHMLDRFTLPLPLHLLVVAGTMAAGALLWPTLGMEGWLSVAFAISLGAGALNRWIRVRRSATRPQSPVEPH